MDRNKTIEILEALASGCSPITGETINESILNDRLVIRALQVAIDSLRDNKKNSVSRIEISEKDIKTAIQLYKEQNQNPTSNKLTGLFLGTRKFKNNFLINNQLYGKYRNKYTEGQLLDFFDDYFSEIKLTPVLRNELYSEIDFFQQEKFNRLSENAIKQLKEKVDELGIEKTENLSEYVQNARTVHPRAYESWSEKEKKTIKKSS